MSTTTRSSSGVSGRAEEDSFPRFRERDAAVVARRPAVGQAGRTLARPGRGLTVGRDVQREVRGLVVAVVAVGQEGCGAVVGDRELHVATLAHAHGGGGSALVHAKDTVGSSCVSRGRVVESRTVGSELVLDGVLEAPLVSGIQLPCHERRAIVGAGSVVIGLFVLLLFLRGRLFGRHLIVVAPVVRF